MAFVGLTVSFISIISPIFATVVVPSNERAFIGIILAVIVICVSFSPTFAVIIAVPSAFAVTIPSLSIETILSSELDHSIVLSSVVFSGSNITFNFSDSETFNSKSFLSIVIVFNGISFTVISHVALNSFSPSLTVAVIVASPSFMAVSFPSSLTVTTDSSVDL